MREYKGYEHYGEVPFNPNREPQNEYVKEVFESYGWEKWDDFYSEKLGIPQEHTPESERAPMNVSLDDFILYWDDVRLLDFVFFEFSDSGIEYIMTYETRG